MEQLSKVRSSIEDKRHWVLNIFPVDLKIVCRIASDIAYCAKDELGECVAAEVSN